ncbi:MAG: hypothetical protein V8S72_02485 [Oscillospiraceae bacterium]
MPRYNKDNVKGLKELLYNSYVHDAELENAEFDFKEDSIKITLFNPIFGAKINFTFLNIETALTIKGDWQGERATIVSLTVEEDFSYLQKYLPIMANTWTRCTCCFRRFPETNCILYQKK